MSARGCAVVGIIEVFTRLIEVASDVVPNVVADVLEGARGPAAEGAVCLLGDPDKFGGAPIGVLEEILERSRCGSRLASWRRIR